MESNLNQAAQVFEAQRLREQAERDAAERTAAERRETADRALADRKIADLAVSDSQRMADQRRSDLYRSADERALQDRQQLERVADERRLADRLASDRAADDRLNGERTEADRKARDQREREATARSTADGPEEVQERSRREFQREEERRRENEAAAGVSGDMPLVDEGIVVGKAPGVSISSQKASTIETHEEIANVAAGIISEKAKEPSFVARMRERNAAFAESNRQAGHGRPSAGAVERADDHALELERIGYKPVVQEEEVDLYEETQSLAMRM